MSMILLCWNVRHGHATANASDLACLLGADVLLLQEATSLPGFPSNPVGRNVAGRSWGSWILVRRGSLEPLHLSSMSPWDGWVAGARWTPAEGSKAVYLFSVHSPTANKVDRRRSYVEESVAIVETISGDSEIPPNAPLVIAGDLNFRSLGHRLPGERLSTSAQECSALGRFETLGLTNAWPHLHPRAELAQTLRWGKSPKVPYHADGFLVRNLILTGACCEVISSTTTAAHSDHNPMVLWIPECGRV